jgi:YbbR domain-containing protein
MFKWLFRNLGTLALSFVLALTVWILAVIAADPDETRVYPRSIPLEITGQDPRLMIVDSPPRQVSLTLRAPQSVWAQLLASDGQVRALIDLAGLAAGEHSVPVQLQIRLSPVRVVSLSPERVSLTLEPLASRSLPVELLVSGTPAIGYQDGEPQVSPRQVTVSGPESLVRRAAKAQAEVKIDGARNNLGVEATVRILDENGALVNGLTPNPERVSVQIPITQQGGYRDIAVKVVVRGQVASGYRLTNISVSPPALTVFSGDPALVSALPGFVETEPLNLNGASQDIELRLNLNLPPGVSVVGEQTVLVQVGVDAIEGSLSLNNMPVTLVGLGPDLQAQMAPETVDIILTGPLPFLEKLTASDIIITLNVADLTSGTYQITPKIEILINEIEVQSVFPGTVEVVISPAPTETP